MSHGKKIEDLALTVSSLPMALSAVIAHLPTNRREQVRMAIRQGSELLNETFPEDAYAENQESLRSLSAKIDRAVDIFRIGLDD